VIIQSFAIILPLSRSPLQNIHPPKSDEQKKNPIKERRNAESILS